jgi:hypothetical protein
VNLGNFRVRPIVYQSHWLASVIAFAAGVWLVTRPQERFALTRPAVRWSLRGLVVIAVAQSAFTFTAVATSNATPGVVAVFPWFMRAVELASIPFPYLFFLHLRTLAQRLPNRSLARHCKFLGPASSLGLLVFVGLGEAARVWLWNNPARFQAFRLPVLVPLLTAGGVLIVLCVWSMITLVRFGYGVIRARRSTNARGGANRPLPV